MHLRDRQAMKVRCSPRNAEACQEYVSVWLPGRTSAKHKTLRNLSCLVTLFIVEVMIVPMLACFVLVHATPRASLIMEACRRGHAHTQRKQVWRSAPAFVTAAFSKGRIHPGPIIQLHESSGSRFDCTDSQCDVALHLERGKFIYEYTLFAL